VINQELKDFTWQELFFHIEEATRKDPKGNKDTVKKGEKFNKHYSLFYCGLCSFIQNRYKHLEDQKKDLNNHKANKRDIMRKQA
jgi:hypothetical protein